MRRVVVTGLGLVTPLGGDVETSWKNILASKSGAGRITNVRSERSWRSATGGCSAGGAGRTCRFVSVTKADASDP